MSGAVRNLSVAGRASTYALRDGSAVHVRPVGAHDEAALRAFLERVSPDSLRRRFCGVADASRAATCMLQGRRAEDIALVVHAVSSPEIVAHAASFQIDATRAEVAFLVSDRWQGRGLGSLLLSRLAHHASSQGVTKFVAEVLPGNRAMIAVFQRCGHPVELRSDAYGVEVEIDLAQRIPELARAA
jgi:RimJ/RimL family protein N-acetyltransferase